ncbi:MAG: DUF3552 domain-containing protein [Sphingobacteriales bacterium]|nr:MAG: DUF3552 domain-containing protein [Sphingobacteriales bacterium]
MEGITITVAIVAVVAILIGVFLGKLVFAKNTQKQVEEAESQAKKLVEDAKDHAETLKEKKILEGKAENEKSKNEIQRLRNEYEKEVIQRNQKIAEAENKAKQLQQSVNDKNAGLQKQINENDQLKENLNNTCRFTLERSRTRAPNVRK